MRKFSWLLAFAVTIALLCVPAEAAGGLTITNDDLPTNTVKVQTITVGDGMGDVSVTVPRELASIIFVRRAGAGACPGGPTVYTCSGAPGRGDEIVHIGRRRGGPAHVRWAEPLRTNAQSD